MTENDPRHSSHYRRTQAMRRRQPSALATALLFVLFTAFIVGGVFFGCIFVANVSSFFSPDKVARPSISIPFAPRPTIEDEEAVPVWEGRERITVLLLGVDQREDERGQPTRTDTMIVATIDPATMTGGMLSIPRDLWVPIPGYGENKINTAHFFGEIEQRGGGPSLAKKTVEYNFGITVHYYARVDFHGFERLIDTIGGITIDVPRPIKDDEYPTEDYGIRRIYIPAGLQRMGGKTALRYARSRHADSDFARNQRQQAVLLAARNQTLQPSILLKLPLMAGILMESVHTDVPVGDLLPLLSLASKIDSEDIVTRAIEYDMLIDVYGDGTVFTPIRERIQPVVEELFTSPIPQPVSTIPQAEPLTIQVLNGTTRDRFAASTASILANQGYVIGNVAQADRSDYVETIILDHSGRSVEAAQLAEILGVPPRSVRSDPSASTVDLTVILGFDAPLVSP